MKRKVAIIGGSGCIGSHTVDLFIDKKIDVTVIDIVKPHRSDVKYIECDILDFDRIEKSLDGFTDVFCLAAVSDANENYRHPKNAMNINIQGLNNMLLACVSAGVNRVYFSSTVWVYSACDDDHVDESTYIPTNNVNHNYTASKLSGEMLIRSYHNMYGLNYTIMRYGIAYGPRSNMDTVVSTFLRRGLSGDDLCVTGDGSSYRNFMYVTDHARANHAAMNDLAENKTINFDGPESVTIQTIAEMVQQASPCDIKIIHNESRAGDYKGKTVCSDFASSKLNWKPAVDFSTGFKKMYEQYYHNIFVQRQV